MSLLHSLALFCGIYFASLGWAQPTGLVLSNMQADIKQLQTHFNDYFTKNKIKWYSQPLFPKNPDIFDLKIGEGEKNLLVGELLRVSQTILSNLKNHTTDEKMLKTIYAIKGRVERLQKDFPALKPDVQSRLQALWAIKADQFTMQLQALRELSGVYSRSVNLRNEVQERKKKRRRRRRQIFRSKMSNSKVHAQY